MNDSPYKNKNVEEWKDITYTLVNKFPLSLEEILKISELSWIKLWNTKVGETIKLNEVDLPASVVGYFFQKLFSYELNKRYPKEWRGEESKSDKDIVNILNPKFSFEMKSSGQMGYKVFGNRSYCQKAEDEMGSSKAKSGYYITINFNAQVLTLISIGWIDQNDWKCQGAESGQAATLPSIIYEHKLIKIYGAYQLESPVELLSGVGPALLKVLKDNNIKIFNDILIYKGSNNKILQCIENNDFILKPLYQYA